MTTSKFSSMLPITCEASGRALNWGRSVWQASGRDNSFAAVSIIALSRVCATLNSNFTDEAKQIIELVLRDIPEPRWTDSDLLLALIASSDLCRKPSETANCAIAYLKLLGEMCRQVSGEKTALIQLALFGTKGLKKIKQEKTNDFPWQTLDKWAPSKERPEDIKDVLSAIESYSYFGIKKLPKPVVLAGALEGAAIGTLRKYDLPLGMRILRACRYLQDDQSMGIATGFDFLRFNQDGDGGFGDCDAAILRMAASGQKDSALIVRLPLTILALWTMSEIECPSFRLLQNLFNDDLSTCLEED